MKFANLQTLLAITAHENSSLPSYDQSHSYSILPTAYLHSHLLKNPPSTSHTEKYPTSQKNSQHSQTSAFPFTPLSYLLIHYYPRPYLLLFDSPNSQSELTENPFHLYN